ncbi:hypothetical protein NDA13_005921 [Ustilago tritici]|nr:hypothetical protein NDA13_005921 [Ustilago tritici]
MERGTWEFLGSNLPKQPSPPPDLSLYLEQHHHSKFETPQLQVCRTKAAEELFDRCSKEANAESRGGLPEADFVAADSGGLDELQCFSFGPGYTGNNNGNNNIGDNIGNNNASSGNGNNNGNVVVGDVYAVGSNTSQNGTGNGNVVLGNSGIVIGNGGSNGNIYLRRAEECSQK